MPETVVAKINVDGLEDGASANKEEVEKFNLESFKRVYRNDKDPAKKETFSYLWNNFNPEEYSIWKCEYKYPEDLTLTFMSCNLISGMIQRLDSMRKNAFGLVHLFGGNNDSTISGIWIWKGKDLIFTTNPDWQVDYESYDWTKLDINDEESRKLVEQNLLCEDGDFQGKKYNQGKILD